MGKYTGVIGLFALGVAVVLIGIYFFLTMGSDTFYFQMASVITLIGLLITGIGAIKGRRTMKSVGYFAEYPPESHARLVQSVTERQSSELGRTEDSTTESQGPAPTIRPTPSEPASAQSAKQSGAKGQVKVVRVLVCPKCGSDNNETDTYCYSCGKKIKIKAKSSSKTKSGSKSNSRAKK